LKRIVLGLEYDGAPWQGWQTQPHGITVQDRLEAALAQFCCTPVSTVCAGRTDTGVHALGQVVHFDTDLERDTSSWVRGVNAFLPPSIAVRWACEVAQEQGASGLTDFHARFAARARTYHYVLYNHPVRSPLLVGKAGWAFRPLSAELMREAAACLIGTHDFSAFRSSQCQAKTPVKTMYDIAIREQGDLIIFTLRASAFLHHMVRNLVGSLVYVGSGREPVAWLEQVLRGRDRAQAAPTFMPDGLYLARIEYDDKWQLPQQENPSLPWLIL
jgi:tRNA pseudouridine38-40 synthase